MTESDLDLNPSPNPLPVPSPTATAPPPTTSSVSLTHHHLHELPYPPSLLDSSSVSRATCTAFIDWTLPLRYQSLLCVWNTEKYILLIVLDFHGSYYDPRPAHPFWLKARQRVSKLIVFETGCNRSYDLKAVSEPVCWSRWKTSRLISAVTRLTLGTWELERMLENYIWHKCSKAPDTT